MSTPFSSVSKIIFPLSISSGAIHHDIGFYSPELTQNRISKEEVEEVMHDISSVLIHSSQRVEKRYFIQAAIGFTMLLWMMVGFIIGASTLAYGIILSSLFFLFSASCTYLFYFGHQNHKNSLKRMYNLLSPYNVRIMSYGLKWNIPDSFSYVELCTDDSNEEKEFDTEDALNIRFFPDDLTQKFECDFYNTDLTDGRLDEKYVQDFISSVNSHVVKPDIRLNILYIAAALFLTYSTIGILYWMMWKCSGNDHCYFHGVLSRVFNDSLRLVNLLILGLFAPYFLFGIAIGLSYVFDLRILEQFKENQEDKLELLADHHNFVIRDSGLKWHIPSHQGYVELWKMYKSLEVSDEINYGFEKAGGRQIDIEKDEGDKEEKSLDYYEMGVSPNEKMPRKNNYQILD